MTRSSSLNVHSMRVLFPIFKKIKELCSQLHLSLNKKTIITTSQLQVNTVCKLCYLELRKLYTLRSFLVSSKTKCLLRVSFSPESTTAIPYFLNFKKNLVGKLQSVQNAATRFAADSESPQLYVIQRTSEEIALATLPATNKV